MSTPLRAILAQHGRLSVPVDRLSDDADLFESGLDSFAMVNVMLAIETEFDVEFGDALLTRRSFGSIRTLQSVVDQLQAGAEV